MTQKKNPKQFGRRAWLQAAAFGTALGLTEGWAQQPTDRLTRPVLRVAKKVEPASPQPSPLDEALQMAHRQLAHCRKNIRDYTCKVVKRERINGKVGNVEVMEAKIRNRKVANGMVVTPFSVYLKFRQPSAVKNREVLFIEGENNNKLLAKEGGRFNNLLPSVWLKPDGAMAMRGQKYPLTDIGIENLIAKLIERGNREKKHLDCEVKFHKGFKVNDRICTMLELKHPKKKPNHEFFVAQVFIDDQLQVPIRYAAYDWPKTEKARPEVIEEYTYLDVKLNVGLKEVDFSKGNPNYNF